jgi:hypothetical protein
MLTDNSGADPGPAHGAVHRAVLVLLIRAVLLY